MILSVSRRTDIPNYYSDWFYNRIREGFLYVRNPMNFHQVSKIDLSLEAVDCIVFWTKNPRGMLARLDEIKKYSYYFQFTLTGYGQDIEPGLPHKKNEMIPVFRELSERIGANRVIWRYDPILFNDVYTESYHIRAFGQIAEALRGYTRKCVISFVDIYGKNRKNMEALKLHFPEGEELKRFAGQLSEIARGNYMEIGTCAETVDLRDCGIVHNSCIDRALIEEITGFGIRDRRDGHQRPACGCLESVDIGAYHTCRNGCRYCYANDSLERAKRNWRGYDADSPILCSSLEEGDRVTERKVQSMKESQISLWR